MSEQPRPSTIGVGPIANVRSGSSKSTSMKIRTGSPRSFLTGLVTSPHGWHYHSETSDGSPDSGSSWLREKRLRMQEISRDCLRRSLASGMRLEEAKGYFPSSSSTTDESTYETPATARGQTKTSTTFVSPSVGLSVLRIANRASSPTDSTRSTSGRKKEATDSSTRECDHWAEWTGIKTDSTAMFCSACGEKVWERTV